MAGYLENYGAGDERREKRIRWLVIGVVGGSLLSVILYFSLRDRAQVRRIEDFLEALQRQDFQAAYQYWGCTRETPCRDYNYEAFLEDWGPKGAHAGLNHAAIHDTERCGTGFIGTVSEGNDSVTLWVERETGVIGYAPWQECPEKKLRIRKWLRMRFGIG